MSNHFTYEIDERKLRVKIKDLELPINEDAWQKFESYCTSQNKQNDSDIFKNFQIPLHRNVILPIVFGGIIILFSFFLFNFINIKNPSKENTQTTNTPQIQTVPNEVKPTQVVPRKAETTLNKTENKVKVIPTKTVAPEQITATKVLTPQLVNPPTALSVSSTAKLQTPSKTIITKTDTTVLKKQKRREVPEMVETEHLPDTRPNVSHDDRETEIRPN